MKYPLVIVVTFLLGTGCSKNDLINGKGDLGEYYMYFEILRENDSSFEEGDVEVTGMVKGVNLLNNETLVRENADFYELKTDSTASNIEDRTLFGPFVFATGWEKEEEAGGRGNELFLTVITYYGTTGRILIPCVSETAPRWAITDTSVSISMMQSKKFTGKRILNGDNLIFILSRFRRRPQ